MKTRKFPLALLLLAAISTSLFLGCGQHDVYNDGINWDGSNSGTLELINGSNKDMILFVGQTPAPSNMLGGVRAGATTKHDISGLVGDFAVGGYAVLRGVSKDEYEKHSTEPEKAKIEFTAMVTYRGGAMYRYNIDRNYTGDNAFRVTNKGKIGLELRKDSPNGEKVAYLPALQVNQMVYTATTDAITLFPVYVFFNKSTGEVSALQAQSHMEAIMATPRALTPSDNNSNIQNYYFPNDDKITWASIVGSLKDPTAYITVVNNIANQGGYITNAMSKRLISQNGYDAIGSGEKLTYELESSDEGTGFGLIAVFYNGSIKVPILKDGEITPPIIRNGYNYSVTVSYIGDKEGGISNEANYKATIVEGAKRDISDQIESL